jgi:hypothetical protein
MKNILSVVFIIAFLISFGSEKYDCIYKKNSTVDWTKKYPFVNAEKIIWVSWKQTGKERPKTIMNFTTDSIQWQIFSDTITIDFASEKKLTDILFNYKYRVKGNYDLSSKCYDPRDAVLFLDKNGRLIDYVEMCFECTDYRLMTTKWKFDFCEGKLDLLAKYKSALFKK